MDQTHPGMNWKGGKEFIRSPSPAPLAPADGALHPTKEGDISYPGSRNQSRNPTPAHTPGGTLRRQELDPSSQQLHAELSTPVHLSPHHFEAMQAPIDRSGDALSPCPSVPPQQLSSTEEAEAST